MSILGKLLGEGLEETGQKAAKKLSKLGKKISVSGGDDIAQDIAVKAPEMQKLYRGIKAETPEKLEKYIADMLDPTIKPRTYEGSAYGEGYYFTPFRDSAESYASNDLSRPYQAVLEIEQPRNRFIGINKQNQNRPVDFAVRAEKRVGGGRAASVGERDFDNYLKKNGILGNRVSDTITVVKDNDAVKNMRVIGRRENGGVWDYSDALNSANVQKDLDNASKFLSQPMYHSTNATFDKFNDAFLGSNTGYDNTTFGHFITPDKEFSQKFGNNTMQIDANIKKYITHPYNADYKYSGDELDKIVSDYLTATDNAEGLQALRDMAAEDGSSLYNAYRQDTLVNNPFDFAADEKKLLQDKGYDAVEFVEGVRNDLLDNASGDMSPVSSYAVFNGDNLKQVMDELDASGAGKYLPTKKNIPVMSDDAAQSIPVYTKDDFITDLSIFDDPAFADIIKNNNIENVMKKATKSDLELVKRAKAGEVLTKDEIRNSRFAKNLGIDAKKAQLKYGNKLNITKAMEEGKEKVPEELEKRLRGMADQVLDRLHNDHNIKYDHKAVIFMGGPSSGKSSAGMKLYDAAKGGDYAVIDSDDIKPMFEEFGKGEGAGAVHLASAYTAKNMVLPDAATEGMNLALPIVGKSDNSLDYHLNLLKNAGYDVSVVDVSLPTDKAASRNFGRMLETNRNVEDTYVRDVVDQKPAGVYKRMVENIKSGKDKRVSGYAKISNDVTFGEPQILEEISPSDVLKRVQDKFGKNDDKYAKLMKKAKGYKTAERFEKMNNPIKGSEIWGDKPTSAFQRDSRAVRINMFPNEATKGAGITKQYLLNMFKDAYDQGITDIVPSYGIFTKEGASFMDHLADQGWVTKDSYGYTIAPKIAEWEKTAPLRDIYNKAHNK